MRILRSRRRWIALGVVLVVAIAAVRALDSASLISYYRVVDDRTLVVGTNTGPGAWTRVTNISETDSTVTISISSLLFRPGPGTAEGVSVETVVSLHDQLGGRTVIDGSDGTVVAFTRCLPPAYAAPGCT